MLLASLDTRQVLIIVTSMKVMCCFSTDRSTLCTKVSPEVHEPHFHELWFESKICIVVT